jgi:EAL domain-containing protein (putative c-di-GMP-specific phosphodiesterase class I)
LNYLRRFPVDKIKIDQTFVADESAKGIVTTIIGLARNLNLKVIAEGVETTGQLEMLRAQGCDEIQGFLIGHAVEPGEFENWPQRPSTVNNCATSSKGENRHDGVLLRY